MPVFAQGEGFTSSKQALRWCPAACHDWSLSTPLYNQVLACGSLPLFLSHDAQDSYFGRWLKNGKHFKLLRPDKLCDDLKNVVW
jgi:hypothetical protein